jgi:hypothetical protein
MYDSISFVLGGVDTKSVEKSLSRVRYVSDPQTGDTFVNGNLRNLQVHVRANCISVHGSLPRYSRQLNIPLLSLSEVQGVVSLLEKDLGLCLGRAILTRVDFAEDLEVSRPIAEYLSCFGPMPRHKLKRFGNLETLSYRNSVRLAVFYDKLLEISRKRSVKMPPPHSGKKILRYELRFVKLLSKQFGGRSYVSDLWDPEFHLLLARKWKDLYFAIEKTRESTMNVVYESPKEMERSLASIGLSMIGGREYVDALFSDAARQGKVTPLQKKRLRDRSRLIAEAHSASCECDAISELNTLIDSVPER